MKISTLMNLKMRRALARGLCALGALLLIIGSPVMAATKTTVLPPSLFSLSDNETVQVALSGVDVNRLLVNDDSITSVRCPSGFCVMDNEPSEDGSVLLSLNTQRGLAPFTFFVSTQAGRHFAVLAVPRAVPAVTAIFTLKENVSAKWQASVKSVPFVTRLDQLMKSSILSRESGQAPAGFVRHELTEDTKPCRRLKGFERTQCFARVKREYQDGAKGALNAVPRVLFKSPTQSVLVYRLINRTGKTAPLLANQWYVDGLQAQAIVPNVAALADGGQAWLYQIVTGTGTQ
uniref:IncF plasmid conjugative transfer pilus assemblyprotein TraK n=1 Tax=Vibrio tasmaniensis TaxID=212663 RepID=A0A0H3ZPK4_9VIBR|nr:IncF plasmid conjugative transfer pilus assemblyprotein TraK [Vibrio tasmaniensis]